MNTIEKAKDKKVNIDNFIGIYDNYITKQECDKAIKLFENETKFNRTLNRSVFEKAKVTEKKDLQMFAGPHNIDVWWEDLKGIKVNYEMALQHYLDHTGAGDHYGNLAYTTFKIQKTRPTEGYHTWHIEHMAGIHNASRTLVFTIYLNDVEDGGETYFDHFNIKIKPTIGKTLIWPAEWTHAHRGEVLNKGKKFIITGWMQFPFNFENINYVPQKV